MEYTIRPVAASELELVLRHRIGMFRQMGYESEAELARIRGLSEPFFAAALSNGTYKAWVAVDESGAAAAGTGVLLLPYQPGPNDTRAERAFIINVYTEPQHRRQGLARKLMGVAVDWCREAGFAIVSLHASNEGRPLYESLGFQATNEMRLPLRKDRA
ncbi:GNAT family N-acetyltransferase [Paludibaculum fermentans]|uniref:GNAT family N-acetyltransferase n=1 Tax=Paludibaculum fermentans TaxID=1473598 RepID=A0A7S7NSW1_PALFE|nr:GNAT family N-acetyltransferase [Paludibaculum fermentans]QOY89223.1 GNAT family N-acetyltransferase [Paludibaculum fermentans]